MPRDTTNRPAQNRRETTSGQRTIGSVNHTNPKTGESFGDSQVYERGRIAVVDGGKAGSPEGGDYDEADPDRKADADNEGKSMADIDHTPREGAPDANEVYVRGGEGAKVDDDEDDKESTADEPAPDDPDEPNVETEV